MIADKCKRMAFHPLHGTPRGALENIVDDTCSMQSSNAALIAVGILSVFSFCLTLMSSMLALKFKRLESEKFCCILGFM